jgi:hypothetical protein
MDLDSTGSLGHYMRMATFSLAFFLHQTEVDLEVGGKRELRYGKEWKRGCFALSGVKLIDQSINGLVTLGVYLSAVRRKHVPMSSSSLSRVNG